MRQPSNPRALSHRASSITPARRIHIAAWLQSRGVVILTHNSVDPSRHGPWEAWAYGGPVDFGGNATTFGVGCSLDDALAALEGELARHVKLPPT
jgi:hypothetical protein